VSKNTYASTDRVTINIIEIKRDYKKTQREIKPTKPLRTMSLNDTRLLHIGCRNKMTSNSEESFVLG
jgi:hypothetical protein